MILQENMNLEQDMNFDPAHEPRTIYKLQQ